MLNWLFGKKPSQEKSQDYSFDCAMCNIELSAKIDSFEDTEPYEHEETVQKLTDMECPFCKTQLALVVDEDRNLSTRDIKWNITEKTHWDKASKLEDEITNLEEIIENDDNEYTEKQIESAENKLESAQNKLEKLQDAFDEKELKYEERRDKWQEKWEDKYFGDDGSSKKRKAKKSTAERLAKKAVKSGLKKLLK